MCVANHLTLNMLSVVLVATFVKVCLDVGVESALQPLDHEPLQYGTANQGDGAQYDVVA